MIIYFIFPWLAGLYENDNNSSILITILQDQGLYTNHEMKPVF